MEVLVSPTLPVVEPHVRRGGGLAPRRRGGPLAPRRGRGIRGQRQRRGLVALEA